MGESQLPEPRGESVLDVSLRPRRDPSEEGLIHVRRGVGAGVKTRQYRLAVNCLKAQALHVAAAEVHDGGGVVLEPLGSLCARHCARG